MKSAQQHYVHPAILEVGQPIKGITTTMSTPGNKEVEGEIVGLDPKPPKHHRNGFMYYVVKLDSQPTWVYIQSKIPTEE